MSHPTENPRSEPCGSPKRKVAGRYGIAGVVGALACTLSCCLPALLVALGASASASAGMAGMNHTDEPHGSLEMVLHLLHRISPVLLVVSIALVAGAFALRRPVAVLPALAAGVVLYVSVHAQSDPRVMYLGMAVGYGAWLALFLWTRPGRRRGCGADEA